MLDLARNLNYHRYFILARHLNFTNEYCSLVYGVVPARFNYPRKPTMQLHQTSTRVKAPTFILSNIKDTSFQSSQNEGLPPNPQGMGTLDIEDKNMKLLNCRQYITISTKNVSTLRKNSKRQEISELLNKHNISIIGVVDHKLVHTDETRYEIIG